MRWAVLLAAVLLLGGCEGLAGLGGALVSTVGGGAVEAFQDKIDIRKAHRAEKRRLMGIMTQQMVNEAGKRAPDDFDGSMEVWDQIFDRHEDAMPKWLFQEHRESK